MAKKEEMLILGIDDAGRGPVVGSMFLSGVLVTPEQDKTLKKEGAKDSKQLTHANRLRLSEIIKKNSLKFKVVQASPEEIDKFVETKSNLNNLEAIKAADIINALNDGKNKIKVLVDCPSNNPRAWTKSLLRFIKKPDNLILSCEHKADINYPSVSAASILSKVAREDNVGDIRKKFGDYGDIGSGYPADPLTKAFLKKNGKKLENSGIFRKSWATWKSLFPAKKQKTLEEF